MPVLYRKTIYTMLSSSFLFTKMSPHNFSFYLELSREFVHWCLRGFNGSLTKLNKASVGVRRHSCLVLKDMNWYSLEDMILSVLTMVCVCVCVCVYVCMCVCVHTHTCGYVAFSLHPRMWPPPPPVSPLTALPVPLWVPILISPTLILCPQRQHTHSHHFLHNT